MSDETSEQIVARLLAAVDDCKRGVITVEELKAKFLQAADTVEVQQWQIIQDLRTQAPEGQQEAAREVAELLEAEMRKGSGTA